MRKKGISTTMQELLRAMTWGRLLFIGAIGLFIWGGSPLRCAEAEAHPRDFSLIHYDQEFMLPAWDMDDAVYAAMNEPAFSLRIDRLSRQTNFVLNNSLSRFSKKVRLSFSPQVVMKPFIAVREVQDMLAFYQSRRLSKRIRIDQNFEAKTAKLLLGQRASIDNLTRSKLFALSPYQNRIYGLHLQINFK